MKGIEESLSQTVFLIGTLLAAVILIYMASQYLGFFAKSGNTELSGGKHTVLEGIKTAALECWAANSGRNSAQVCSELRLNESLAISSDEISGYLKGSLIPEGSLAAESFSGPGDIVVSYKNNQVFIENR